MLNNGSHCPAITVSFAVHMHLVMPKKNRFCSTTIEKKSNKCAIVKQMKGLLSQEPWWCFGGK